MNLIYSIITLFWKITYYLSRISRGLRLTSLKSKNMYLLKLRWKLCKIKVKKKKLMLLQLSLSNMSECAWMYQYKQDSEYAWGHKYAKILNMAKFWIWRAGSSICERYTAFWICQNMSWQSSEYILHSKCVRILNMAGFWICKNYTGC